MTNRHCMDSNSIAVFQCRSYTNIHVLIHNLAMVPCSCLEKADGRTRIKIWHEVSAHRLQRGSLWTIVLSY